MKTKMSEENKKILDDAIAYLESCEVPEWTPTCPYPAEIGNALYLLDPDFDYIAHCGEIEEKGIEIEEMNVKELAATLTSFYRAERFCDGAICSTIEDGRLLRVFKRIKEIIK